jgi:hypothetical protein
MATASVVELFPKSTPDGRHAVVLQFPAISPPDRTPEDRFVARMASRDDDLVQKYGEHKLRGLFQLIAALRQSEQEASA